MLDIPCTNGNLRRGITVERATDLLLRYLGMDVYRVLVSDLGWTRQDWVDWTAMTITEQISAT